jgi:phenylacetate-CoA ligase
VAEGEVGEVVVTTLNPDYPLIRFGTGILSGDPAGTLPDRPEQPADPRLARPRRPVGQGARPVRPSAAGRRDRAPPCRSEEGAPGGERRARRRPDGARGRGRRRRARGLAERIAETIRDVTKLRGTVSIRTPGSLPNDGKLIDDTRKYD